MCMKSNEKVLIHVLIRKFKIFQPEKLLIVKKTYFGRIVKLGIVILKFGIVLLHPSIDMGFLGYLIP